MLARVNAIPHEGFWRLGRKWPCAGVEVDLTEEELATLRAEPKLHVLEVKPAGCPDCAALGGERPCSVECWVKAGYKAENFERQWSEGRSETASSEHLESAESTGEESEPTETGDSEESPKPKQKRKK